MSELRALKFVGDGTIWVLSGGADDSTILAFKRTGNSNDSFTYTGKPVAQYQSGSALLHPFDFVFDPDGYCYVSNQDTDVVARFVVDPKLLSATPASPPGALKGKGSFWPGTFVASADATLPRGAPKGSPHASTIAAPAGLEDWPPCANATSCPKLVNSVRGVAWANGMLYVADEVAAMVKVYDPDGNFTSPRTAPDSSASTSGLVGTRATDNTPPTHGPVHLLVVNDASTQALLATNGRDVLSSPLDPKAPASLDFQPIANIKVPKVSGLTLAPAGVLYAASREKQPIPGQTKQHAFIYKYTNFAVNPTLDTSFSVNVDDLPEFVLYVPDIIGT
jgi:hypothetical protein